MKYRLIFNPEVYISVESPRFIVYNTLNMMFIEGKDENFSKLLHVVKRQKYMCVLDANMLEYVKPYLHNIIKKGIGDCIPMKYTKGSIQSIPIINVQRDFRRNKGNMNDEIGNDIMTNLHEINLFIELGCQFNCEMCKYGFHQNLCCSKFSCPNNINALTNFLKEGKILLSTKINLILCGSMKQENFIKIYNEVLKIHDINTVYVYDANFCIDNMSSLNCKFNIIILPPFVGNNYYISDNIEYTFLVHDAESLKKAEEVIINNDLKKYSILPLATRGNGTFLYKHVFYTQRSVLKLRHSFKDIHRNRILSSFLFGKISILPNGKIYASLNRKVLGNIYENKLYEIVRKELMHGHSWFITRQKMSYCKYCTYKDLCPSVSECELFIKKRICKKRK